MVDHLKVSAAREYLSAGFTLKQAADLLGVLSNDLDRALWIWFGVDIEHKRRAYEPDFVA